MYVLYMDGVHKRCWDRIINKRKYKKMNIASPTTLQAPLMY